MSEAPLSVEFKSPRAPLPIVPTKIVGVERLSNMAQSISVHNERSHQLKHNTTTDLDKTINFWL